MPNNIDSQFDPQQSKLPQDAYEEPADISRLTPDEQIMYTNLNTDGWNDSECLFFFKHVRVMQETLVQKFRAKGWNEDQLRAFNESCSSELPEHLSTPPADHGSDYEWQIMFLEEMNRRKRIGENMDFSTS